MIRKSVQSQITGKWAQSTRGTFKQSLVLTWPWSSLTDGCPEVEGGPVRQTGEKVCRDQERYAQSRIYHGPCQMASDL